MSSLERIGDIEIGHDIGFQRREWVVQRVGWMVMLLIVIAALLGLFGGGGPLNNATLGDDSSAIRVHYKRFDRVLNPTDMQIELTGAATAASQARVWISKDYLEHVQIESISPEPVEVTTEGDRDVYTFEITAQGQPARILFAIKPQRIGTLSGQIGLEGGESHTFQRFIYP